MVLGLAQPCISKLLIEDALLHRNWTRLWQVAGLRFGLSGDGKKIYLYGAGSSFEVFDGETLQSRKLIFLNKDTTTNLVTLAAR